MQAYASLTGIGDALIIIFVVNNGFVHSLTSPGDDDKFPSVKIPNKHSWWFDINSVWCYRGWFLPGPIKIWRQVETCTKIPLCWSPHWKNTIPYLVCGNNRYGKFIKTREDNFPIGDFWLFRRTYLPFRRKTWKTTICGYFRILKKNPLKCFSVYSRS